MEMLVLLAENHHPVTSAIKVLVGQALLIALSTTTNQAEIAGHYCALGISWYLSTSG